MGFPKFRGPRGVPGTLPRNIKNKEINTILENQKIKVNSQLFFFKMLENQENNKKNKSKQICRKLFRKSPQEAGNNTGNNAGS